MSLKAKRKYTALGYFENQSFIIWHKKKNLNIISDINRANTLLTISRTDDEHRFKRQRPFCVRTNSVPTDREIPRTIQRFVFVGLCVCPKQHQKWILSSDVTIDHASCKWKVVCLAGELLEELHLKAKISSVFFVLKLLFKTLYAQCYFDE